MPWEERTVTEQREEFVKRARGCRNFSALCREYGISRKTGYKWVERAAKNDSLFDRSRRPDSCPLKTPQPIEQMILNKRVENPGWGAKKIKTTLENETSIILPSARTVDRILLRNGMISPEESAKHMPFIRFEREKCNELWQTDFKGFFYTLDGLRCYPLDILDDHSRYVIGISATPDTKNVVIPAFLAVFREYGLPSAILSDNGSQFAGFRKGYTKFEKWLMDLDILPIHGRFFHPQTQGKIERFHRTMKQELLNHRQFQDCRQADEALKQWRLKYNNERPHESLGDKCPAQIYVPSERQYPERIPTYTYDGQHVIKVNTWGYVRFAGFQIYLSETMIGEWIEFRANPHADSFLACYRNYCIAEFSVLDGTVLNRSIRRL